MKHKKIDPILIVGYIVVVLVHLIGYLVTRTTPDMSQMEIDRLAMVKVVSGIFGIVSIFAVYALALHRGKRQQKCSACGAIAQSPDDQVCLTCGASLVK